MSETLSLIVTRSCNIACVYCPVSKSGVHLGPRAAREAIREHACRGGGLVRLTGGEPALNWRTASAALDEVEKQRELGHDVRAEFCTNGSKLGRGKLQRLDRPWIRVVLSLDGTPAAQEASGRSGVRHLDGMVGLPGFTVTQTISPEQAGSVLDNFLYLWDRSVRRFNFLPVYYVPWSGRQVRHLLEGLEAVAAFLAPKLGDGGVDVRNLHRTGRVPLFNDDLTLDADGTVYRTNLVLADSITHPLLGGLRAAGIAMAPPVPRDLRDRLEALLEPAVRRSTRKVDAALDRFVRLLRSPPARPRKVARRRRKRPERLEFHISYECTNSCAFCSEAHRLERWTAHPVGAIEVRRTILSHARTGGNHINLTGGEPSVHPAFIYALDLARSLGMRTFVGTNGARLADAGFAALAMPLIDELSLSLHGSTPALHDRATGRRGSFGDLMDARAHAGRRGKHIELFINTVVTKLNFDDLPQVVDLCSRLDVPTLIVSSAAPEGRALDRYPRLAVKLARWREVAADLACRASDRSVNVRFFGLPLCVLGEARMKSNDLHWDPRITVERARGPHGTVRLSSISALRPTRGRKKTRRCRGCSLGGVCGGVFVRYIELYGDEEIEAIRD